MSQTIATIVREGWLRPTPYIRAQTRRGYFSRQCGRVTVLVYPSILSLFPHASFNFSQPTIARVSYGIAKLCIANQMQGRYVYASQPHCILLFFITITITTA